MTTPRTRTMGVAIVLCSLTLAVAGCGSSSEGVDKTVTVNQTVVAPEPVEEGPCIITGTGNKLCGTEASAWCRAVFTSLDSSSMDDCIEVQREVRENGEW